MSRSENRSSSNCPSCGAPIASAKSERCAYCGALLDATAASASVSANNGAIPRAWRRAWVYLAVVLGFSGFMAFRAQRNVERAIQRSESNSASASSGRATTQRVSHSLSELLATIPQTGGGLAAFFSATPGHDHVLTWVDATTSTVRWTSPSFSHSIGQNQVAVSDDHAYVVDESRLVALQLKDGAVAWEASLVADFMTYSDGFRLVGDQLVVLERDGTTQVFDRRTGKTLWSEKHDSPSRGLLVAGHHVVELLNVAKKRGREAEVHVLDLVTGEITQRLRPRCSTHSIIPANEPSVFSHLLLSQDGEELYLFYGINRACAERWNLRDGTMAWQVNRNSGLLSITQSSSPILLDADVILYPGDRTVYAIRRKDGQFHEVITSPDNHLLPKFVRGDLAIIAATPTWDRSGCENGKNCSLWAVDIKTGAVVWRHALPKISSSGHRHKMECYRGSLDAAGFTLAQIGGEEQVVLDRLSLDTGVSNFHKQIDLATLKDSMNAGIAGIQTFDWMGDTLWLSSYGSRGFTGIDAQTGNVRYRLE